MVMIQNYGKSKERVEMAKLPILTYHQKEALSKLTNEWQNYAILGRLPSLEALRRNHLAERKDGEYTGEIYFRKIKR